MLKKYAKTILLFTGPLLFLIIHHVPLAGLSAEGQAVLACTAWIAFWWITEAVELPVTSILPILIFPLSGAMTVEQTTSSYGSPFIFLFMGGFIVGLAIEKWELHKRIAYGIIGAIGTSEKKVLLGFMLATGFLSMWISNTATAIMMLPIGISVASHFGNRQPFSKNIMLGIAYAASIGGVATLIGTPPNIILAGIVKESLGIEISFLNWMLFATPFSVILLWITWFSLTRYKPVAQADAVGFTFDKLGKMSTPEKRVAYVFVLVAFFWISRSFIWNRFFPTLDDTMIAIFGALLMFLTPAGKGKGNLMDWKAAKKIPWGVLLLFGAGLAIAKGFSNTDLTVWLAGHFTKLALLPVALIMIAIIAGINFLTEITSNTATASMILPVLITLGVSLNLDVLPLLTGAAIASSCAFMLPVATPPNAIVFSSGKVTMTNMIRAGFFLNIASILLIYIFIQYVWHLIF
ncbi:SLC13 family permease [Parapedobacter sp. 10938]|uniref:SLC13 family permease n=1 Tax=Parapedobacter flavus TaxID=3110225 RepID=UPI002DBF8ED6|nr:SLC13 family permease [Parapedobacter sp. 10938]MEC3879006.1 SLC13 family permease [Parapedobacter sp. 10938]